MSLAKQIGLVAAGCQPWNPDVCAASQNRFAYCSTLAVYIFQLETQFNEYRLHSIQSEHKKTIKAIAWSPYNNDLIVSASSDGLIVAWNVSRQEVVSKLQSGGSAADAPCSLAWGQPDGGTVLFIGGRGPLQVWRLSTASEPQSSVHSHPEAKAFKSDVSLMKCHPNQSDKIALGHADGSVSIFNPGRKPLKHVLNTDQSGEPVADDKVTSIEWDPLSTDYLLVATAMKNLMLVDSNTASVAMYFERPAASVEIDTLAWIPSAPGMFATGDSRAGILRLWNVSKALPLENIRLKKAGFRTLLILANSQNSIFDTVENDSGNETAAVSPYFPSSTTTSAVPSSAVVLCAFLDGGVGLYDLGRRNWTFLQEMGHIETIFDCQFQPENPDLLATGSFDGTVKVWDVTTLKPVFTSAGNEGVIYSLSWSPSDMNCIAVATSNNGMFVIDTDKGKVIRRYKEHGDTSVFCVAWNQKDSKRIASAGGDNTCVIRQLDGKLLMKYSHPSAVYGCDWSPHNTDIIATGCADKIVRVFYLATNNDKELKKFSGHTAKVFKVKWCPLREGILVSGSDDNTVRMWDYTQDGGCIRLFQGHTGPVRGLLWNPEVPYLLVSGSWDYTIRIWDTRDGACLDTILDHGADVYGLSCHVRRPFIMASCSRDSTLRIWSLSLHVQPLELNVLAGRPWNEIVITPERAVALGTPPLLTGKASRDIKLHLESLHSTPAARKAAIRLFSKLFANPAGSNNLWELVDISLGNKTDDLSSTYSKGIMHSKHLTMFKQAEAQQLEITKPNNYGDGIRLKSQEERIQQAAAIYIRLGNVMRYCELMVKIGQWEKALQMAPGVSIDYWRKLMKRYAQFLVKTDSDDSLPYCIAAGDVPLAVQHLTTRGQHADAMLVAAAADEGNLASLAVHLSSDAVSNEHRRARNQHDGSSSFVHNTSDDLAESYFNKACPIQAACCHLSVDNHKKAICKLIRGGELELAVGVGLVLNTVMDQLRYAINLLSRRCERLGLWELGIHMLKMVSDTDSELAQMCSRCAASMSEINFLHKLAGFETLDECAARAASSTTIYDRVKYYILSSTPELGLEIGLSKVKEIMASSNNGYQWQVEDVRELLLMMASLQTERLLQPKFSNFLLQRDKADVPLSQELIEAELEVWQATHPPSACFQNGSDGMKNLLSPADQIFYDTLIDKVGRDRMLDVIEAGPDCLSGSRLPSHSDVNVSCLDGQRIVGPSYFLEDGHSCLSINDAVMWAKVNPFSPLGSGMRINPF